MSDFENKNVRGYQLNVTIGSGGFGTVYHAYQEVLNREVAVKVIKDKYINDPQFIRQFEAEAKIIARMEHFNIVTLYDYWRDPSGAYLVMRWLRGGSLRSYLKQAKLDIPQVVRVINQTASALSFAHQHNVIHRDIKPENILLDSDGNAFLTDFGIAVDLRNQDESTVENFSFGSPDYVAPEQLKDRILTTRSDIYSLGIMLYELLAHQRPFVSADPKEIMKMQLFNPVPSLRLKRPDLPPEIDTVIWQSTAKNPAHRYDNVLELAVAFQNIAQRLEAIPTNYIISTKIQTRSVASFRSVEEMGDPSTQNLSTAAFDDWDEDFVDIVEAEEPTTGILPEYEEGLPEYLEQIDTIPDALPTSLFDETEEIIDIPSQVIDFDEQSITDDISTLVESDAVYAEFDRDTTEFEDPLSLMTMTIDGEGPPNPYKGLRSFEETDEGSFFGREEIVSRLVDDFNLTQSRFLALIGPSGSGKSSVVKAGMIPAFRRGAVAGSDQWFYSTMIPSDDPFRELSEAILRVAIVAPDHWDATIRGSAEGLHKLLQLVLPDDSSQLLLFIDQFEEVFTLGDDDATTKVFLNSLWYALNQKDSRLRVIITLRADFYDRPLFYPKFGQMLKENTEVVLPLNLQELEMAILGPAGRVGLLVEPALKNAILNDVYNQSSALPLLQYALTELYERKPEHHKHLSHQEYLNIGGIEGALAQRAHEIFNDLSSEEQMLTRKLFLRIIAIDENATVTRRRVLYSEMASGIENEVILNTVLDVFSKHRLLTRDRDQVTRSPTIEVAHEALINGWQQLRQWIAQNRAALQKRQELRVEVDSWLNNNRDRSYLASGSRLAEFEGLINNNLLALRQEEHDFITSGIEVREASAIRSRRINYALSIFSIVTMILLLASLYAFRLANEAQGEAVSAAQVARSRELAASSIANRAQNDLSLLLAVEAGTFADTYEAENSLLLSLQENSLVYQYLHGHESAIRSVDYDSTGTIAVSAGYDNTVIRWDLSSGQMIGEPLAGHDLWINAVQISPDDRLIASAGADSVIRLWDLATGEEIAILDAHESDIWSLVFSPDSSQLASAGEDGQIIIWDIESGTIVTRIEPIPAENGIDVVIIFSLDFNSDGTVLVSGSNDNLVRTWDVASGEQIFEMEGHPNWVRIVRFDPSDNAIISGDEDGVLFFWDAATGLRLDNALATGLTEGVSDIAFSFDGQFFATSGFDGRIVIWSLLQRGVVIAAIHVHQDSVWTVDFSPNELSLMSAGDDGDVIISLVRSIQSTGELMFSTNQSITEFATSQSANYLVLAGAVFGNQTDTIQVWNRDTEMLLYEFNINDISTVSDADVWAVTDLALSPDASKGAVALASGEIAVWDLATGNLLWIGENHEVIAKELEFTVDGNRIISADESGVVLLWDVETGDIIETSLYALASGVTSMVVSPDGQYLAIGGRENILLWDLSDETLLTEPMDGHENAVSFLLFDPSSTTLISGSRDREIVQWAIPDGTEIQRFFGHQDWILSLAFSPSGDVLVSGDRTGVIYLWELNAGRQIGSALAAPQGWLTGLHFIDDTTFVASNRDINNRNVGITMTWTIDVNDWRDLACRISNRTLTESEWEQYLPNLPYQPNCISAIASEE